MQTQFRQTVDSLEPDLLQLNDSGSAVQTLQLVLKELSFYHSSLDGYFGPHTVAAVRQLQKHFGLAATGQFDAAAWYALTFWADPPHANCAQTSACTELREPWQFRLLRPFYSH